MSQAPIEKTADNILEYAIKGAGFASELRQAIQSSNKPYYRAKYSVDGKADRYFMLSGTTAETANDYKEITDIEDYKYNEYIVINNNYVEQLENVKQQVNVADIATEINSKLGIAVKGTQDANLYHNYLKMLENERITPEQYLDRIKGNVPDEYIETFVQSYLQPVNIIKATPFWMYEINWLWSKEKHKEKQEALDILAQQWFNVSPKNIQSKDNEFETVIQDLDTLVGEFKELSLDMADHSNELSTNISELKSLSINIDENADKLQSKIDRIIEFIDGEVKRLAVNLQGYTTEQLVDILNERGYEVKLKRIRSD